MREDKVAKQQQLGLAVTNPDSAKPEKPYISDKYNNWVELKKINRKKEFTK